MALTPVASNFARQTTTATTIPIAWTPAGAGNMLIISFQDLSIGASPTVADTNSNVWVNIAPYTNMNNGAKMMMWYCTNCNAGATTITVTSGSSAFRCVMVSEWSGQDQIAAFDVHHEGVGNSATYDSGAATTTSANQLIFGFISGASSTVKGASFTQEQFNVTDQLMTEYKIVSSTGSYSADATGGSGNWGVEMATFEAAAASSGMLDDDVGTSFRSMPLDQNVTVFQ